MSETPQKYSEQLWASIEQHEEKDKWCEWDTLTAEWQEYVIALRRERDDARTLLGEASNLLAACLSLLKNWLSYSGITPGGARGVTNLANRTKAFLNKMGVDT